MKIEKLYTREQFDKILRDKFKAVTEWAKYAVGRECFELELKFSELHSGPLTKEMFVNELVKPDILMYSGIDCGVDGLDVYYEDLNAYNEAEKKVIFLGFTKREYMDIKGISIDVFDNEELDIFIDISEHKTLGELAEDFKGELNIKLEI